MKKDKFIFYSMALNILLSTAVLLLTPEGWFGLGVECAIMLGGFGLFVYIVSKAVVKPVKLFTPIPVKLNNQWCFTYYLTEGSEMISPAEMLHRKLIS